jgi:mxaA protein
VRLILLAMLVVASMASAQDAPPPNISVGVSEPRSYGYFVGDTFSRIVNVSVASPYKLDQASRPAPGRLNYWLDLRDVNVTETEASGLRRYRLSLDYQTFYVPLSPAPLTVPGLTLRFSDADGNAVEAEVPPFKFVMAPLREVQPEQPEEGPDGYLKPDVVPRKVNTLPSRTAFGIGAMISLISLILLVYHRSWWPFRARPHRPFTQAARAIRTRATHDGLETYRDGLLELHRAFDRSAGRRLLAEDVPGFLAEHREFQPLEQDISRFFETSRRAFFSSDLEGAARIMPFDSIATLGSRLGEAERRAA